MTDFNCPGDHSSAAVARPPLTLYEVRTTHGEAYWAEGDVIEQGDGWFTLWASEMVMALRLPEADIRAVRSVTEGEREAELEADHPTPGCLAVAARNRLREEPTQQRSTSGHVDVQGRCPACGSRSLFLGDGGYVTCPRIDCPEPDAASTLLDNPQCAAETLHNHLRVRCIMPVRHGSTHADGSGLRWSDGFSINPATEAEGR
ncbi:hypothetical protein [Streptomyces sp. NPDC057580]|uniref:hypothetical protein n=1 Tax=Streptomyces sp. NPDC057580 TaxID=3346173 RepID=UPI003690226D